MRAGVRLCTRGEAAARSPAGGKVYSREVVATWSCQGAPQGYNNVAVWQEGAHVEAFPEPQLHYAEDLGKGAEEHGRWGPNRGADHVSLDLI